MISYMLFQYHFIYYSSFSQKNKKCQENEQIVKNYDNELVAIENRISYWELETTRSKEAIEQLSYKINKNARKVKGIEEEKTNL